LLVGRTYRSRSTSASRRSARATEMRYPYSRQSDQNSVSRYQSDECPRPLKRATCNHVPEAFPCGLQYPHRGDPRRVLCALQSNLSSNKAIILRSEDEFWSKGNLAVVDELYAPNFIRHFVWGNRVERDTRASRARWRRIESHSRTGTREWRTSLPKVIASSFDLRRAEPSVVSSLAQLLAKLS
jgi:hypothetical protein